MEEKTLQEKYELAKMVLMLIERFCLAIRAGHVQKESALEVLLQIGNAAHVANHENGEATFDCGPDRDAHHAAAIADYKLMHQAMLNDIAAGTDYSQMLSKKTRPRRDEVDFDEVEPVKF